MSTQISQHADLIIIILTTIFPTNNTQRVRTEPKAGQGYSQVRPQNSIKVSRDCRLICMPCFTGSLPKTAHNTDEQQNTYGERRGHD